MRYLVVSVFSGGMPRKTAVPAAADPLPQFGEDRQLLTAPTIQVHQRPLTARRLPRKRCRTQVRARQIGAQRAVEIDQRNLLPGKR